LLDWGLVRRDALFYPVGCRPKNSQRFLRPDVLSMLCHGVLGLWTNDGAISYMHIMRCPQFMGQEILPALRETDRESELRDHLQKALEVRHS
jgi:hypothetical protein